MVSVLKVFITAHLLRFEIEQLDLVILNNHIRVERAPVLHNLLQRRVKLLTINLLILKIILRVLKTHILYQIFPIFIIQVLLLLFRNLTLILVTLLKVRRTLQIIRRVIKLYRRLTVKR